MEQWIQNIFFQKIVILHLYTDPSSRQDNPLTINGQNDMIPDETRCSINLVMRRQEETFRFHSDKQRRRHADQCLELTGECGAVTESKIL